jgi:tRNA-modifying protein YgfZ
MSDTITASTFPSIDQAEYAALINGAALLARPDAGVLRLTEADRHDFLQRMTTNNISVLRPGQSAVTVLTSPVARILFVFTVIARADDLILLPAPGQGQALARHLRSQIFFMDKVKVHDLGEQFARLRVMGPQAAQVLAALGIDAAILPANGWAAHEDYIIVAQPQYEVPGFELLVAREILEEVSAKLVAAGAREIGANTYDAYRIELGRPAAGSELIEEYNPLEAGLAWTCAENKGCYTGQEIIARQITYDKVTKTLVGLRSTEALTRGSEVMVDGRSVGVVTSIAHSPALNAPVALAMVKRPHNAPGTVVQVNEHDATVVAFPFVAA